MTTFEKNNSHFVVEHSFDGVSFNEVGTIAGCYVLNELTQLFIYPNPASEIIIIHYFSSKGGDCTVQITDIAGRVLLQQEVFLKIGENSITFPLTTIQKGNYRITIRDSEKFSSELLLVE